VDAKFTNSSTVPSFFLSLPVRHHAELIPRETEAHHALKAMSISKLMDLREKVDATLASKVSEERRALQSRLMNLGRVGSGAMAGGGGGARAKVEPKYRNPENPAETWAGRGLRPRWLTAAIKAGKKLEDFRHRGSSEEDGAKEGPQGEQVTPVPRGWP